MLEIVLHLKLRFIENNTYQFEINHIPTFILYFNFTAIAMGQSATLRGIVLNELNEPLEGVNVVSENNGTTTNINGFYILKIPANTDVKFDFLI